MGWNSGYTIVESTVVALYDLGKLDRDVLDAVMEPYRGTDIDSGGSQDLRAKDGKSFEEIVIKVWGLKVPRKPGKKYDPAKDDAWQDYNDEVYSQFRTVCHEYGW